MTSKPARSLYAILSAVFALHSVAAGEAPPSGPAAPQVLSLEECLRIAMEKNHRRPASRLAVAMAEAQHRHGRQIPGGSRISSSLAKLRV